MRLQGKKIAILLEQLYEDLEFWYPYYRLKEEGAEVVVIAPKQGEGYPSKHGYAARSDLAAEEARAADFDGVVVPGGFSPDHMRRSPPMVEFLRQVGAAGKPVAAICHGGWMLASAGLAKGRRLTSFHSIKDDMVNAGADWVDEPVVVDGNVITSRFPPDLPDFTRAFLEQVAGTGADAPRKSA